MNNYENSLVVLDQDSNIIAILPNLLLEISSCTRKRQKFNMTKGSFTSKVKNLKM